MKERGIIMTGHSVRGIRDDRKHQTRRLAGLTQVNSGPGSDLDEFENGVATFFHPHYEEPLVVRCPYGVPGDRLWVRETFNSGTKGSRVWYAADGVAPTLPMVWRPSIFMPRWASRLTLELIDVRPQLLQSISESEAKAEGVELDARISREQPVAADKYCRTAASHPYTLAFAMIWDEINGDKMPWSKDPYVWALTFRRVDARGKQVPSSEVSTPVSSADAPRSGNERVGGAPGESSEAS